MDRENYYLLLELSYDPPETDPKAISAAINKKQSQWSRYRNHPTKSTLAKRYIGMIPDIKKVLGDPGLREKEAEAAKKFKEQENKARFEKLDRHIRLLMKKGEITDKEVELLCKVHGMDEKEVRSRIKKNEKMYKIEWRIDQLMEQGAVTDKKIAKLATEFSLSEEKLKEWINNKKKEYFEEIEAFLDYRAKRGFIPEQSIDRLLKIYPVRESDIVSRLKCPVQDEPVEKKPKKRAELDETIENLVNENLKIVGKKDIYDFLELDQSTSVDVLLDKAREKEVEIRRIGQKDAVATASGALAGLSIVIFESNKSKLAYDNTLTRSKIREINQDINIAGMLNKEIRDEYFKELVRTGVRIGMNFDESYDYIVEYCENEGWTIKDKKRWLIRKKDKVIIKEKWTIDFDPKKPSFWIPIAALIILLLILYKTIDITSGMIRSYRISRAYSSTMEQLESQASLEGKLAVMKPFVHKFGDTEYGSELRDRMKDLENKIEKRDYERTVKTAERLAQQENFEGMREVYTKYIKDHPKSPQTRLIREKLAAIPERIENRDYNALKSLKTEDYTARIKAYNAYFKNHPNGKHLEEVKQMVLKMVDRYYNKLVDELNTCQRNRDWQACMNLCDDFVKKFKGTEQAMIVEGFRIKYQKRMQYENDLANMRRQADSMGYNFQRARSIYTEYLKANPEAPDYIKTIIDEEIKRLDALHEKYLAEEKEWKEIVAFSENVINSVSKRVDKLESYLAENPGSRHEEEAKLILAELRKDLSREMKETRKKEQERLWREILQTIANQNIDIAVRIQKMNAYISSRPDQEYLDKAKEVLVQLLRQKEALDDYNRKKMARDKRVQEENASLKAFAGSTSVFTYNENGVIVDRRKGLMWVVVDSAVDLGKCIDYYQSVEYVEKLSTGGYTDWRVPTPEELMNLYKNEPYFPTSLAKWYWTSETIMHGWNKKANIVTTKHEKTWKKMQVNMDQCGAVRAVRNIR